MSTEYNVALKTENDSVRLSLIQTRLRHRVLVDKKFLDGLTASQVEELKKINDRIDAAEAKYYDAITDKLAMINLAVTKRKQGGL